VALTEVRRELEARGIDVRERFEIDTASAATISYNLATHTATWQFPGLLADGNYRATLLPG